MKKKLLFFIFFLGSLLANAQTEYAVLIKSQVNPRSVWPPDDNEGFHYAFAGANGCTIDLYGRVDKVPKYCFFYVIGDPTQLLFTEGMGASQICGTIRKTVAYNKDTFSYYYFNGCLADSEIMAIHIPELPSGETNGKCSEEIITLKNGWNWRYQLDNGGWVNFPLQFQEKTSISFKIKDLPGYTNQSQIHFQAGYQTQFTNIRTYSIIGCSPELQEKKPTTTNVKCDNESSGSATLKFKTDLNNNDKFLFNLYVYNINLNSFEFLSSEFAEKNQIYNKTFTWNNIAYRTYFIKYQAQSTSDNNNRTGSNAISTDPFIIENVAPLTYTATGVQPKCSTDTGGILIRAAGGTPPYYYILNNQAKKELTTNPFLIPISNDGDHKVIILDSNNCLEK